MTTHQIFQALQDLSPWPNWVVFSGGNPALLDLYDLVQALHSIGISVMVETQGTEWKEWLEDVDELCVSPKPPSSGMLSLEKLSEFMGQVCMNEVYLKVVVFDETDYQWAKKVKWMYPHLDFFLSVGNEDPMLPTVGNPEPNQLVPEQASTIGVAYTRGKVLEKTRWLFEKVANDPEMADVRVMPQLHTLAWGNERGR